MDGHPIIRVQPGASNYYCHEKAINHLEDFFSFHTLSEALFLYGERAGEATKPYLGSYFSEAQKQMMKGHCSHTLVDELAEKFASVPLVIGIGGGSVLDTAKALATVLDKPFVAIPTIAATCAACTPLSVWYDVQGKALGYEIFPQGAFLVLVEPKIIAKAPQIYMKAGIADTLAKWYEAKILVQGVKNLPLPAELGLLAAKRINEVLFSEGEKALESCTEGKVSHSVLQIIDSIIVCGALVGGLGERFTRIAAAHAIHNGLSALEETHGILHGIKVAYGILVQSALEEDQEELISLLSKFKQMGLPTSLSDLGIEYQNKEKLERFIAKTLVKEESIHLLPFTVTPDRLRQAICTLEEYNANYQQ